MSKDGKRISYSLIASALALAVSASMVLSFGGGFGGASASWVPAGYDDHQNMMDQLGIKTLRPGKSGNNQTGKGFDEATANDWMPTMPEVLTMKNGVKVTSREQWTKRRAEILEDFEREVYGRIPKETPKITWEISEPTQGAQGGVATLTRRIIGRVDNSAFPQINVSVNASFTVPANAPGPVPVLLEFGMMMGGTGGGMGGARGLTQEQTQKISNATQAEIARLNTKLQDAQKEAVKAALAKDAADADVKAKVEAAFGVQGEIALLRYAKGLKPIINEVTGEQRTQLNDMGAGAYSQLYEAGRGGGAGAPGGGMGGGAQSVQSAIQYGWGYGTFDTASVQADSGGNALRQGIIGLCNRGEPRKPDDWGSLRAWQWGISRIIDLFEAHPELKVDPKKVAVEGVSRYGKAAIVTEAFEPRLAVALVASSGEGGVKLHRHDFGEAVENLTGGEYYWMCGNFMKYGASDIKGKSLNASDIPVDSHELIALCAPRPCFISYGIEPGDPKWVDAPGSYRAGILASPVYGLFGAKGYGDLRDWVLAPLPPVGTLVGGELAFRQHSGGHTAGPNFQTFFQWISNYIKSPAASVASAGK
jgi:Spy/CpxP family protein refolding chaperone